VHGQKIKINTMHALRFKLIVRATSLSFIIMLFCTSSHLVHAEQDESNESASQVANQDKEHDEKYSLEDVVVTATRYATSRLDTPVPVDVITPNQMEQNQPANVTEAASASPGVNVNSPSGGYYTNPNIRGLGGRRVVMLLDGRRVDSGKPIGVSGYFLSVSNIQRIEIMRGPGSVLYGSDAIGGVIHVISVDPLLTAGFSTNGHLRIQSASSEIASDLGFIWANKKVGVSLFGQFRDADNYYMGDGNIMENSDFTDGLINLAYCSCPVDGHRLVLRGWAYLGDEIGRGMNDLDLEKRRVIRFPHDRVYISTIDYRYKPVKGVLEEVQILAGFDYTDRLLARSMHTEDYSRITSLMTQQSDFWNLSLNPVFKLRPISSNRLLIGMDGRYRRMSMLQTVTSYLPGDIIPPSRVSRPYDNADSFSGAVFAQDEQRFWQDKIRFSAGIRWDSIYQRYPIINAETASTHNGALSGNLGLVISPIENISLTLNAGRAFRSPTMEEKFVELTFCKGVVCGKPEVKPETSWNFDIGFKGSYSILDFGLYGYAILLDDYIALKAAESGSCDYQYTNISRALLAGGELRLQLTFRQVAKALNVRVFANTAYVYGKDLDLKTPLPQIPPLSIKGGLRLYGKPRNGVMSYYAELAGEYHLKQTRVSPMGNVSSQQELPTDAYGLLSCSMGIVLGKMDDDIRVQMGFRISNLVDAYYRDHLAAIPGMGRNAMFTFRLAYK